MLSISCWRWRRFLCLLRTSPAIALRIPWKPSFRDIFCWFSSSRRFEMASAFTAANFNLRASSTDWNDGIQSTYDLISSRRYAESLTAVEGWRLGICLISFSISASSISSQRYSSFSVTGFISDSNKSCAGWTRRIASTPRLAWTQRVFSSAWGSNKWIRHPRNFKRKTYLTLYVGKSVC